MSTGIRLGEKTAVLAEKYSAFGTLWSFRPS